MKSNFKINVPVPNVIIAIVGPSVSGKTTMANVMAEAGIPTIVSYTTRPMRDGETNGKEHWFVTPDKKPKQSEMIAYTQFGDYEYWATKSQITNLCTYVIDEKGLEYLMSRISQSTIVFSVYIDRDIKDILKSGVDKERCARDKKRKKMDLSKYDYVIHNNYTLDEFRNKIIQLTYDLLK